MNEMNEFIPSCPYCLSDLIHDQIFPKKWSCQGDHGTYGRIYFYFNSYNTTCDPASEILLELIIFEIQKDLNLITYLLPEHKKYRKPFLLNITKLNGDLIKFEDMSILYLQPHQIQKKIKNLLMFT